MDITIKYHSSWQTGVIGDDTKKPITKQRQTINRHASDGYMQKFVATSGSRGENETPLTQNTVLGVLNRLIGDQRKLYQAKKSNNFYFKDIEQDISFKLIVDNEFKEIAFLTNKSDSRCGQNTWMGVIPDDCPWFDNPNASSLWAVLCLDRAQVLDFILNDNYVIRAANLTSQPLSLKQRVEILSDVKNDDGAIWKNEWAIKQERLAIVENIKKIEEKKNNFIAKRLDSPPKTEKQKKSYNNTLEKFKNEIDELQTLINALGSDEEIAFRVSKIDKVVDRLIGIFPTMSYWNDKGVLYPIRVYAAALYIRANRLLQSGVDINFCLNNKNEISIQGFSKRGFNGVRDWLNPMTGSRKKSVGTPCEISKQDGVLVVQIKIDKTRAREIETLIENAGVSSFYLGKKGLAYVSDIRI